MKSGKIDKKNRAITNNGKVQTIKKSIVMSFENVKVFEEKVAAFFGSKYAVAFDSCTHGLEAALHLKQIKKINVPKRTYISIPFLAKKLKIDLEFSEVIKKNDIKTILKILINII